MRTYTILRHRFSIDHKFTVYENGNERYLVRDGRLFGGIDNLVLENRFGTPLIRIEKEPGHFLHSTYKLLSSDGRELAKSEHFGRSKFEINTIYGPYKMILKSLPSGHYYSLWNPQNQNIASKGDMTQIAVNQDQPYVLALVLVINHLLPSPSSGGGGGGSRGVP